MAQNLQLTDAQIEEMAAELGLSKRRISGVSKTVVTAANGAISAQSEFVCSWLLGDGSGSMEKWRKDFIEAYNQFYLRGLRETAVPGSIMVATGFFYDERYMLRSPSDPKYIDPSSPDFQEALWMMHAPVPLETARDMTPADFDPQKWNSMTPMFDGYSSIIQAAVSYAESVGSRGKLGKTILILFGDGLENASVHATAASIKNDHRRLMELTNYVPVFVGFGRSKSEQEAFTKIALEMGFPEGNILAVNAGSNDEAARKKFRRIINILSEKVAGVSQNQIASGAIFTQEDEDDINGLYN